MNDVADSELWTVKEVAKVLNCSSRHVYRLADAGSIPRPMKLGALVRWPRRAVLDFIEQGCDQKGVAR